MPFFEEEEWLEWVFMLTYSQYGGSALQIGYSDLMEMGIGDMFWFLRRLGAMREAEAEALSKKK